MIYTIEQMHPKWKPVHYKRGKDSYKRKQMGTFAGFKNKENWGVYSYLPSKFVDHLNWDT